MPRWNPDKAAYHTLLTQLEQLGFYKYIEPEMAARLKVKVAERRYLYFHGVGRLYYVNSEDLAQGGVLDFIRTIQPFLEREGVIISSMDDFIDEEEYSVTVDGTTCLQNVLEGGFNTRGDLGANAGSHM